MIDWSKKKPREILEIARSIPSVAGRWVRHKHQAGDEVCVRTLWKDGVWTVLQITRFEDGWSGSWDGHSFVGKTLGQAQERIDELLRKDGYLLDDDLPCNVEDGVTMWCRGCGRLKNEHQTYPNDDPRA